MKTNLFLIFNQLIVLLLIQSDGFYGEQGFNSSLGEVEMESMVPVTFSYTKDDQENGEKGEDVNSNRSSGSSITSSGDGENGIKTRRLEDNSSGINSESSGRFTSTTTVSTIDNYSTVSSTENSDNENEEERIMSYIEGKILEIVPMSEVPYESFTDDYHENDSEIVNNDTNNNETHISSSSVEMEKLSTSDLQNEESSIHHTLDLPKELDQNLKLDGNEQIKGNHHADNNENNNNNDTDLFSKQQINKDTNNDSDKINFDLTTTSSSSSMISQEINGYQANSPLSKVNDLRTAANTVAVKVAEVKKKSLAAKMMERLRKSDKASDKLSTFDKRRPSSLLAGTKDLVYVNTGNDGSKKNIIVVSNGSSGGGSSDSSGSSHAFHDAGSRHHFHHHIPSHQSGPESHLLTRQVVPIFTPIDETNQFQHQGGQQQENEPSPHHGQYLLFPQDERDKQGDSRRPEVGEIGGGGSGENGEITGHNHQVHGLNNQVINPENIDSPPPPPPVDNPHWSQVNSLVGSNGPESNIPHDLVNRGSGDGGRSLSISSNHHNDRHHLTRMGSTLSEHLIHPGAADFPHLTGNPSLTSLSSVLESLGSGTDSASSSSLNSGSTGRIFRTPELTLSRHQSDQIAQGIVPFFESSKSSSKDETPVSTNTDPFSSFSLLSDSNRLSNLRALLGSSSTDLSAALLGSTGSSSSILSPSSLSSSSLNERLLSSLLEQSSKLSTLDDLNDHLNPLHGTTHHSLTELTSSRLGGSTVSSSGLLGEDISLDDALKRLTVIEMLNKKQIPVTSALIGELRGDPSPLQTLSGTSGELRKLKELQQLGQVQRAIKNSQQSSFKIKSAFDQEQENNHQSDENPESIPISHKNQHRIPGRGVTTRYRITGKIQNGSHRGSTVNDGGNRGIDNGDRSLSAKTRRFEALSKLREQHKRIRNHFRPSTKSSTEEEEEEYEESGVEHEGDESQRLLMRMEKPLRSDEGKIPTIYTDNFHHLNGQVTNSLASLLFYPKQELSSKLSNYHLQIPHPNKQQQQTNHFHHLIHNNPFYCRKLTC